MDLKTQVEYGYCWQADPYTPHGTGFAGHLQLIPAYNIPVKSYPCNAYHAYWGIVTQLENYLHVLGNRPHMP